VECGTEVARNTPRSGEKTQTDSLLSQYVDSLRQQVVGLGSRRLHRRVFGRRCPARLSRPALKTPLKTVFRDGLIERVDCGPTGVVFAKKVRSVVRIAGIVEFTCPARPYTTSPRRGGTVAVELLLAFPVAFLFFLAVAEFGLLLTNMRHVELAAYEGARAVSRLDRRELDEAVFTARWRADRTLLTAGTGRTCLVMIEHNVPGAGKHVQVSADRGCRVPNGPRCPLPNVDRVFAVRCTVAVPMRHLAPDLLAFVGFSLKHRKAYATVTLPYCRDGRHPRHGHDDDSKHGGHGHHGNNGGKRGDD
jgi:hypothetical protein